MKNKTFIASAGICICAVLLANTSLLIVPVSAAKGTEWFTAISNLSNNAKCGLLPAIASGLIILLALERLRLWQCSFLCLAMAVLFTLIQNFISPLINAATIGETVSYSISFSGIIFYFQEVGMSYLFPVFIIGLSFYGFILKKHMVSVLCTIWGFGYVILLHLLPPFFQQFDRTALSMDGGKAARIHIYMSLLILAVVLLCLFIITDLKAQKATH